MAGRHDKERQLEVARAYGYQAQIDSLQAQGVGKTKPVKKAAAKKTTKKATAKKSTAKKTAKKA